jgi:two-component system, NarL family, response regulator DevR
MENKSLTLLLVDDHELVRLGIKELLRLFPYYRVVAEASEADEAVARALQYRPDVIIMDIRLGRSSGLDATRAIKAALPGVVILMLTSSTEDALLQEAWEAGASGYVLKQVSGTALLDALEAVRQGTAALDLRQSEDLIAGLERAAREAEDERLALLTDQELRVLALVGEGLTNREIAARLNLAEGTIRNYTSAMLQKLGLTSRVEAAAFVAEHRLWEYLPEHSDRSGGSGHM